MASELSLDGFGAMLIPGSFGGTLGNLIDVSPNFLPLVQVIVYKNGHFFKFSRYIDQDHTKNHF